MSDNKGYYELPHTADLALHVEGNSPADLLLHAAQGLTELMQCQLIRESKPAVYQVVLASLDLESLLIDWLNELVYLITVKTFFPANFDIPAIQNYTVKATLNGSSPMRFCRYIKAATFGDLAISKEAGYQATVIFDV